jgi:predicted RNA binding protein YcfA (HicA-like mRNA interferase family)
MPKQYSSNDVISTLKANGFEFITQKGSHMKFRKGKFVVIVQAGRKVIPLGTLRSIRRQAGFGKEVFGR